MPSASEVASGNGPEGALSVGGLAAPAGTLASLLHALPIGVAVLDRALRITHGNAEWTRLCGVVLPGQTGAPLAEALPDLVRQLEPALRDLVEGRRAVLDWRLTLPAAHDTVAPVEVTIAFHPIAASPGEVTGVLAVLRDMAGEQALNRSEARFRRVVEAAPDGMAMVNAQGRIVLVNETLERLFGWSRAELIGQSIDCLMPEPVRNRHPELLTQFFADPQARDMAARRELYALRRDGSQFPVEIGLNPMEIDGSLHTLATIVDVTERRADRALLERALSEKTALLQEVHHRVKNNLQVISSLLSLQSRGVSGPARVALAECQSRVKAMALIHQLLYERNDFSAVALALYLQRLCSLLRDGVSRKQVSLDLDVEAGAEELRLDLDCAMPCGLLVNELISNALKHAFPDGRRGSVRVGLRRLDTGHCLVTVADDGIGLPPDIRPGTTQTLGFQLVPLLVNQLGAELALTVQAGTCFDITLNLGGRATP